MSSSSETIEYMCPCNIHIFLVHPLGHLIACCTVVVLLWYFIFPNGADQEKLEGFPIQMNCLLFWQLLIALIDVVHILWKCCCALSNHLRLFAQLLDFVINVSMSDNVLVSSSIQSQPSDYNTVFINRTLLTIDETKLKSDFLNSAQNLKATDFLRCSFHCQKV